MIIGRLLTNLSLIAFLEVGGDFSIRKLHNEKCNVYKSPLLLKIYEDKATTGLVMLGAICSTRHSNAMGHVLEKPITKNPVNLMRERMGSAWGGAGAQPSAVC